MSIEEITNPFAAPLEWAIAKFDDLSIELGNAGEIAEQIVKQKVAADALIKEARARYVDAPLTQLDLSIAAFHAVQMVNAREEFRALPVDFDPYSESGKPEGYDAALEVEKRRAIGDLIHTGPHVLSIWYKTAIEATANGTMKDEDLAGKLRPVVELEKQGVKQKEIVRLIRIASAEEELTEINHRCFESGGFLMAARALEREAETRELTHDEISKLFTEKVKGEVTTALVPLLEQRQGHLRNVVASLQSAIAG